METEAGSSGSRRQETRRSGNFQLGRKGGLCYQREKEFTDYVGEAKIGFRFWILDFGFWIRRSVQNLKSQTKRTDRAVRPIQNPKSKIQNSTGYCVIENLPTSLSSFRICPLTRSLMTMFSS